MAEALRKDTGEKPRRGKHARQPWSAADAQKIFIHTKWETLKGTVKGSPHTHEKYLRAKRYNDRAAAADIVEGLIDDDIIEAIVDEVLRSGRRVKVAFPYPEFDPDIKSPNPMSITNAIPFALAAHIARVVGGDVETEIIELARPGRTDLNRFERFLWQPCFDGKVDTDCVYVLVDDTCSLGGTFAALRSHIVANGGTVIAATALSHTSGSSVAFGIAEQTANVVLSRYSQEISSLWVEEIGHDIHCLTELEGAFLADWEGFTGRRASGEPFQQIRERLAEAKASGRRQGRT